jgi:hypothetical protein
MLRLAAALLALTLGVAALVACHEHFDEVPTPDLAKVPETFGFDLAVPKELDMSEQEHPDLAKPDAA